MRQVLSIGSGVIVRLALAAVLSMAGAGVRAQTFAPLSPPANAGTLICTPMPAHEMPEKIPDDVTALSCSFDAISGPGGVFAGTIKRAGTKSEDDENVVLVWSVLAPTPDVQLEDLEGQYVGALESSPNVEGTTSGLRGGAKDAIELRPIHPTREATNSSTIAVLELALRSARA